MFIGTLWAQWLTMLMAVIFTTAWTPFIVKWGAVYASPKITGSFFCSIFAFAAIIQVDLNLIQNDLFLF
jgi:hypothetical protein